MRDKNKSIIALVRERMRDLCFSWWRFKAVRIYGNHLHPTVRLSSTTTLDKSYPGGVHIDEYTYLAGGVIVFAHDLCRRKKGETYIGKQCFIGVNAIIMCGCRIGNNVIVGAGSIVTKDVPSNCIVAGNPARIIRTSIKTGNYGILVK